MQKAFELWRVRKFELAAAALAFCAAWIVYTYLSSLQATEPVVQAKRDLLPGWRVQAEDIETKHVPRGAGHPLRIQHLDEAVGLIVTTTVRQGASLLSPDLANGGPGGPLAVQLSPGERAVFIPWTSPDGPGLEPGDWVDLIAVWDRPDVEHAFDVVAFARVISLPRDDYGSGALVAAVPADTAGDVVAAMARGTLHPVLRPLSAP